MNKRNAWTARLNKNLNERFLWHGTDEATVPLICTNVCHPSNCFKFLLFVVFMKQRDFYVIMAQK